MRIDWRRVLVVELALLAGCALLVVAWWLLTLFAHTVLLLFMGVVVAFTLQPAVARVEARVGGRRGLAAAVVYLGVLAVLAGGIALLVVPLARQSSELLDELPRLTEEAKALAPDLQARLTALGLPFDVQELQTRAASIVVPASSTVLQSTVSVVGSLTSFVVDLVLILVISFYLVLEGPRIRAAVVAFVPVERRRHFLVVESTVVRIAGAYVRGQLLLAVVIGVLSGAGAWAFGLRYPHVIGVIAGVLELVPMIGPILGAVPAVLLALLMPFPTVLWVILYFVAVQQLENYVLVPRISGEAVGLHPLAAMLALVAGFELAGILGGLFAVPVAGMLWSLGRYAMRRRSAESVAPS